MKILIGMYGVVAFFVTLATIGHLMGAKRRMHMLDILMISTVIGTLWAFIPWVFKGDV